MDAGKMLSLDVVVNILLELRTTSDLFNCVLVSRIFYQAFQERRALITRHVLCADICRDAARNPASVLKRADKAVQKTHRQRLEDVVMIYEAVQPIMQEFIVSPVPEPCFAWAVRICKRASKIQPALTTRQRALLNTLYSDILRIEPLFDPMTGQRNESVRSGSRLHKSQKELCYLLALDHQAAERLEDKLEVQQNVLARCALTENDAYEWANAVVHSFRALQQPDRTLVFEANMYAICRAETPMRLAWARHMVTEHQIKGRPEDAVEVQRMALDQLRPGTGAYVAWARQLIRMLKRLNSNSAALEVKKQVWQTLTVRDPWFFAWSRELADEYRMVNRIDSAMFVLRSMVEKTQQWVDSHPPDNSLQFHLEAARRALGLYENCGSGRSSPGADANPRDTVAAICLH